VKVHQREGDNIDDGAMVLEGLCIDMMKKLSGLMGFTYTISFVPDGQYGAFDEGANAWNGLVKHLIDHVRVDML